jgi:hypothetical protein
MNTNSCLSCFPVTISRTRSALFPGSFGKNSFSLRFGGGLDGRGFGAVAQLQQTAVRAEILAIVARFVAVDEFERAGIVAEGAEGERRSGRGVLFRLRGFGLSAHFVLHASLLHTPDSHLTPAGDGHVFDEGGFDGGLWLEFFVKGGEERAEAVLRFAFENDGAGKHAVGHGVAGGGEFALGGGGAAGFGAGGLGLTFGAHTIICCMGRGGFLRFGGRLVDFEVNIGPRNL